MCEVKIMADSGMILVVKIVKSSLGVKAAKIGVLL